MTTKSKAINAKAGTFRDQRPELERAAAGDAEAGGAATATLEAGYREAIESARNRAAAALKVEAKARTRETEITALRDAIEGLYDKTRRIGQHCRAKMGALAVIVTEARSLAKTAIKIDRPGNYAPQPYAMPSLASESISESGRVAIELAPMREKAISAQVASLHAEGFTAGV